MTIILGNDECLDATMPVAFGHSETLSTVSRALFVRSQIQPTSPAFLNTGEHMPRPQVGTTGPLSRGFAGADITGGNTRLWRTDPERPVSSESTAERTVATALRWLAASRLVAQLVSWAATIVTIRLLEPSDYGLMAVVTIFTGFLSLLSDLGLGTAVIREPTLAPDKLSFILGATCLVNLGVCALLFFSAPAVAATYGESRLIPLVRFLSLQFLVEALLVIPWSLLQRRMNFRIVALIDTASLVLGSVVTVGLAWQGLSYWSLAIGTFSVSCAKAVLANAVVRAWVIPRLIVPGTHELLSFGVYLTLNRLVAFFAGQADMIIASRTVAPEVLGTYAVAVGIAMLPVGRVMALTNQVALPAFARIQDSPAQVRSSLLQTVRLLGIVVVPILWGLSSVARELVSVALTARWGDVAIVLALVPLVLPLQVLVATVATVVVSHGRGDEEWRGRLLNVPVMAVAFLVGAQWGIVGLSLAWVAGMPIITILNLRRWRAISRIGVLDVLRQWRGVGLAAGVMYLSVLLCRSLPIVGSIGPLPRLVALVAAGALVYTAMAWWMMRDDVRRLLRMAR